MFGGVSITAAGLSILTQAACMFGRFDVTAPGLIRNTDPGCVSCFGDLV